MRVTNLSPDWRRFLQEIGSTHASPTLINRVRTVLLDRLARNPSLKSPFWSHRKDGALSDECCAERPTSRENYRMLPARLWVEWPSPTNSPWGDGGAVIEVCGCGTVREWTW